MSSYSFLVQIYLIMKSDSLLLGVSEIPQMEQDTAGAIVSKVLAHLQTMVVQYLIA